LLLNFYEARKTDIGFVDARLRLVTKLVLQTNAQRVLDAACGRGTLLSNLRSVAPGIALAGCDISPDSAAHVRKLGFEAASSNLEDSLPFEDESFDCVVLGEVLEHLIDPDRALLNVARVLRRDGNLVVTTPNLASWFNRLLLLAGIQPIATETSLQVNLGRKHPALGQWKPTQGHLKLFVKGALCEMLAANGFVVLQFLGAPYNQPTPFSVIDRALAYLPSLASNFVVLARNLRTLSTDYPRLPGWLN
jgi:SAM-dependent methyltransferase